MEVSEGVYTFPQTLELGDMSEKIYPLGFEKEGGLLLVDPGLPGNLEELESAMQEHGFGLEEIETVLVTHQDFDHAGGLAELLEAVDATVLAHRQDAPAIDGREDPIKADDRYPEAGVDVELSGGEVLRVEAGELEVLHTPGHTPGHLSLRLGDTLFASDAMNVEDSGLAGPRDRFTPDMEGALESLHALSFLEFDTVFCFHGGEAEAGPEEVSEIAEKGLEEFKGYEKAEGDLSDRFLRRELPNSRVGLSRFELEAGSSHGSRDDPESGHRHSEQYEIYFVESGSGSFYVGDRKKRYEPGDAFLVKPYRYRRITADEDTVFFAAGAPVDDGVESE